MLYCTVLCYAVCLIMSSSSLYTIDAGVTVSMMLLGFTCRTILCSSCMLTYIIYMALLLLLLRMRSSSIANDRKHRASEGS